MVFSIALGLPRAPVPLPYWLERVRDRLEQVFTRFFDNVEIGLSEIFPYRAHYYGVMYFFDLNIDWNKQYHSGTFDEPMGKKRPDPRVCGK